MYKRFVKTFSFTKPGHALALCQCVGVFVCLSVRACGFRMSACCLLCINMYKTMFNHLWNVRFSSILRTRPHELGSNQQSLKFNKKKVINILTRFGRALFVQCVQCVCVSASVASLGVRVRFDSHFRFLMCVVVVLVCMLPCRF